MPKSKYSEGLEGKRFNRTVIVSFSHSVRTGEEVRYYWNFLCDCGTKHISDARSAFRNMVQSCGCLRNEKLALRTKHGATSRATATPEYTSWKKLRARIDNPNNEWFHAYGGRGIRYCQGLNDFSYFLGVVGPRPKGKTIDRINNEGNYSCGKCAQCLTEGWPLNIRWATIDEQNSNKRITIYLTFNGRRQALFLWAKEFHVTRYRLYSQYKRSEAHALALLESLSSTGD